MTDWLRRADSADSDAIARIYVAASVAALGPAANREAIDEAASGRHAMWAPLLRPEAGQVDVFDDGAVRGFVSFGPAAESSAERSFGHVYALYVEPDRWHEGIGGHLLAAAVDELRESGMAGAELWVHEENSRARRFYEARAWTFTGDERANNRGNFLRYVLALFSSMNAASDEGRQRR